MERQDLSTIVGKQMKALRNRKRKTAENEGGDDTGNIHLMSQSFRPATKESEILERLLFICIYSLSMIVKWRCKYKGFTLSNRIFFRL